MRRRPEPLLVLVGVLLCACGSHTGDPEPENKTAELPEGKVVVTTKNGRALEFSDFKVDCYQAEGDQDGPPLEWPAVAAVAGSDDKPGISVHEPRLHLSVGAEVFDGQSVTLPFPNIEDNEEKPPVTVYVSRTGGKAAELSSVAEESFGEIEVVSASCEPTPSVELRVDGDLHSEFNGGGRGVVRGHVKLG